MRHALKVVADQVGFQVFHAEVGPGLFLICPGAAHEDFVTVHRLLKVGTEFFKQVSEAACDAGVFGGFGDLLGLDHLFEQCIEQLLPVLLAQRGRQDVELFNAGLLERHLGEQALCVQLDALAIDVQKPQRWLGVVLGQRGHLGRVWAIAADAVLACAAQATVAKAVEWGVLALVVVLLLVQLFDQHLDLVVGQGR